MRRKTSMTAALVFLALPSPAAADVVSDWAELQSSVSKATEDPQGNFDVNRVHAGSRVMLAMFEAANAVDPRYESFLRTLPSNGKASSAAAISAAARGVLLKLYPSQKTTIENAYKLALDDLPAGLERDAGVAIGERAAKSALAAGGIDPARPVGVYRPASLPGKWSPSTVPFPPQALGARPWFLRNASDFRLPPPPPLTSVKWAQSLDEVRRLGAKDSKERSEADTLRAQFWAFYELDPAMRQIANGAGRTLVQNARMYALLAMAADDMDLVMADGKMSAMLWRPLNAIRSAGEDGNDATEPDLTWEPLLRTPSQPEYPCGHCMFAGLIGTILEAEGPPPTAGYVFTNDRMPGLRITVPTMRHYVEAVSLSRIHAGVHYRMTNEVSMPLGRTVAQYAMSRFAAPVRR